MDVLSLDGSNPVEGFVQRRLQALACCREAYTHSLLRLMPDTGFLSADSDTVARILEMSYNRGKSQARPCDQVVGFLGMSMGQEVSSCSVWNKGGGATSGCWQIVEAGRAHRAVPTSEVGVHPLEDCL